MNIHMGITTSAMRDFKKKNVRSILDGLKVHVGCGTRVFEGFENLDNSPSVLISKVPWLKKAFFRLGLINEQKYRTDWSGVRWCEITRGLPYRSASVSKIYSSHFLEHLPETSGMKFLQECYRVLSKEGAMRLVVPDLYFHARRYVERTRLILDNETLPTDRSCHDEFMGTVAGGYLSKKRFGLEHRYMYDLPALISVLQKVGFSGIKPCNFQEGTDMELALFDNRPQESIHLEISK